MDLLCVQYSSVRKSEECLSEEVGIQIFKPLISCIYVLHSILAENWLLEYGLHITRTWTSYDRNTLVLRKVTTRIRCRGRNMHVARERGRITGFDVRYVTEVFPDVRNRVCPTRLDEIGSTSMIRRKRSPSMDVVRFLQPRKLGLSPKLK